MALVNLQTKVYPETEQDFLTLMAESDCKTKGNFLELLLETYKNPKTKIVTQDTAETLAALATANHTNDQLQAQIDGYLQGEAAKDSELAMYRQTFADIQTIFGPYLVICKRDKLATDYVSLFKLMLSQLHKGRAFILEPADMEYCKSQG